VRLYLVVAVVALVLNGLTGCGGGSGGARADREPSPAPSHQAAPVRPPGSDDHRPVLVAFGDSLTAGAEGSYPWYLQRDLDRAGYHWRVINEGVAGDTTTNGLARIPTVLAQRPEIVILELGGNDGLRGVPVEATRANLEEIITALLDRHITVMLAGITLPPNYGVDYIRPFEQMYKDLAARHHLAFLPFLLEDVALVPGMMSEDGIHPTVRGNEGVARNVYRVLKPLLDKRQGPERRREAGARGGRN
jgi:acyl-CoA thioesterase I